jgi:hypothetical protein
LNFTTEKNVIQNKIHSQLRRREKNGFKKKKIGDKKKEE